MIFDLLHAAYVRPAGLWLRHRNPPSSVLAADPDRRGHAENGPRGEQGGEQADLAILRATCHALVPAMSLLDFAGVQSPHAERHGRDARRDEPSGRMEPWAAAIRGHCSSVRFLSTSVSARGSDCRLTPRAVRRRLAASPPTRKKSLPVHDDGGAFRPAASMSWQQHIPRSVRPAPGTMPATLAWHCWSSRPPSCGRPRRCRRRRTRGRRLHCGRLLTSTRWQPTSTGPFLVAAEIALRILVVAIAVIRVRRADLGGRLPRCTCMPGRHRG